ncbi:sugar transferase [Paenibacillus terrigena]|uniref:sugar transferase n=1 Tax=Paenibacillus terrigena TaxID=369333 RepID=UPI00036E403F|nr:sugar transferase [Paenibacillus terrigena]
MKRCVDCFVSVLLMLMSLPVWCLIYILVRLNMGKPVLYRQERAGLQMKTFYIYKFRTLTMDVDEGGELLADEMRLTPLGKWLRRLSLDELPQLINVLKGDMSLVGPRPLLVRYNPYYSKEERKRFRVRPGITGLAQVSGRNLLDWDARLALDVLYVEDWTLWLDIQIVFRTVIQVIQRKDIADVPSLLMKDMDIERGL